MTPMQELVFKTIQLRRRAGISVDRLLHVLEQYRNVKRLDPPKNPRKIVHVTVNQINNALGPVIHGEMGGDRLYHFDPADDAWKGTLEAYRAIRERKAQGGPGWEP